MHIVALGWLYVTLMMAINETSVIAGLLTFLMYGIVPVAILLYISGSKRRKRARDAALSQRRSALSEQEQGQAVRPQEEDRQA